MKGKPIDGKTMASRFAVDAFTTAAFSTNVTDNEDDLTKEKSEPDQINTLLK